MFIVLESFWLIPSRLRKDIIYGVYGQDYEMYY
jgi:hypothetical protein